MNTKYFYIIAGIILALLLIFTIPKYSTGSVVYEQNINSEIEKIEVYHFHSTRQCYSCKTVGAYAEETINTYFQKELMSGKIIFNHINIDNPENKALSEKYGAIGSSLFIGVYGKNGEFSKQEDVNVWYKIDNKENFIDYLKGVIEKKFSGE